MITLLQLFLTSTCVGFIFLPKLQYLFSEGFVFLVFQFLSKEGK